MSPSEEARMQSILLDTFGDKIRPGKIAQWIRLLESYPINAIAAAFDQYFRESRYPPAPNNILERLNEKRRGNRTPEEAAALIRALPIKLRGSSAETMARRIIQDHGAEDTAAMMEESYPSHGAAFVRELVEYSA